MTVLDPVALAQALIRCSSVTPKDEGALGVMESALKPLGFACHRLVFEEPGHEAVANLYARVGTRAPLFCFAGHSDVVSAGAGWQSDPFGAEIRDGVLHGRGAADMKSGIAAFVAATARHLAKGQFKGSIGLIITGDEEGEAINGTAKVLAWLKDKGERIDHCIVGEPTSTLTVGDTIKIGRRGSLNLRMTVKGIEGHAAYPASARNPIPALAGLVVRLSEYEFDKGTAHFEPSMLVFTGFDVGNPAVNVIPAEARAACNIRFNDRHTPDSLTRLIESEVKAVAEKTGCEIIFEQNVSGGAFLTRPGPFTDLIAKTVAGVTGKAPAFSTAGGTSDARFIKDYCPVAELGLVGATMHKANECVPLADIHRLTDIYAALLNAYFKNPPP